MKISSMNLMSPYFLIDSIIPFSYFSRFKANKYAKTKESRHSYLHKLPIIEERSIHLL